MATCQWCNKDLPSEDSNVCGSCLLFSLEDVDKKDTKESDESIENSTHDLSYLEDTEKPKINKSRTLGDVGNTLNQSMMNELNKEFRSSQEMLMKKVKVQSNSIRSKLFVVDGELVLNFDENGVAECFESDIPKIQAYSHVRPNRFSIIEEPVKVVSKPVSAPKAPPVAKKKIENLKPNVNKPQVSKKITSKVVSKKTKD